jgi:hypothetical protein
VGGKGEGKAGTLESIMTLKVMNLHPARQARFKFSGSQARLGEQGTALAGTKG